MREQKFEREIDETKQLVTERGRYRWKSFAYIYPFVQTQARQHLTDRVHCETEMQRDKRGRGTSQSKHVAQTSTRHGPPRASRLLILSTVSCLGC
jgi:hypothetical protein